MITVRSPGGTARTITKLGVRDGTNISRLLKRVTVRDQAGTPHVVWSTLSATVSSSSVTGSTYSHSSARATTDPVTATPVGGTGPFTYNWVATSADGDWFAVYPGNAATPFRSPALFPGDFSNATFVCSVTDSSGATATTPPVNASAANNNPYA